MENCGVTQGEASVEFGAILSNISYLFICLFFETGSHYVVPAVLELRV